MHRAFRSPILPALQSAARTRLYSSATTTQQAQAGNATEKDRKQQQRQQQQQQPSSMQKNNKLKLNSMVDPEIKMRNELSRVKSRLNSSSSVKEIQDLVQVDEMMTIYRKFRDEKGTVNASEPIHAILTTLRLRTKILKPVISAVRRQIMGTQNAILSQYLNEIADDLVAGRSYASHFALSYMLTAFSTMEDNAQASAIWKKFAEGPSKNSLAEKLDDPRVVSAALRSSDPSVLNLDEFERIYKDTTAKHGRYLLADDALAMGYLRFREYAKAVDVYASMCEHYNLEEWAASIIRLHNQILTQCTDLEISKVFFDTAVSAESFVQLHPSAAARYLEHYYSATGDVQGAVDIYCRAMHRLETQPNARYDVANCINVLSEVLKCVVNQHFALKPADKEAQELLERIIAASPQVPLIPNTVLSYVSKAWPTSEYIVDMQKKYFSDVSSLGFDSIRVLLNSCHSLGIDQVSTAQIAAWWEKLLELKQPQIFDWLSLGKACDNADRVGYFGSQIESLKPNLTQVRFEKMPFIERELSELNFSDAGSSPEDSPKTYSSDMIDSEIHAREGRA